MEQITSLAKTFIEEEINDYLDLEFNSKNQNFIEEIDKKILVDSLHSKYTRDINQLINKYHLISLESLKARFNKSDELMVDIIESLKILV